MDGSASCPYSIILYVYIYIYTCVGLKSCATESKENPESWKPEGSSPKNPKRTRCNVRTCYFPSALYMYLSDTMSHKITCRAPQAIRKARPNCSTYMLCRLRERGSKPPQTTRRTAPKKPFFWCALYANGGSKPPQTTRQSVPKNFFSGVPPAQTGGPSRPVPRERVYSSVCSAFGSEESGEASLAVVLLLSCFLWCRVSFILALAFRARSLFLLVILFLFGTL